MTETNTGSVRQSEQKRLFVYNAGFLVNKRLRRILTLAGYNIHLGLPKKTDRIGVWGNSPTAGRGRAVAKKRGASLLHVEDPFLRSLFPGRAGEPPAGLLLDQSGIHFDPGRPSDLEQILATSPLDDTALLNRARDAIARIRASNLSKFNAFDPDLPPPPPGYVLVVDQTLNDASVRASNGNTALFREMLVFAQEENPGAKVIIKIHPETSAGFRAGHFSASDENDRIQILSDPISPWELMDGAIGVYTVSSHLGFEAILAGHKPRVFGQPFYAGWGLTRDEFPLGRRTRNLTRAQLFAAAMILYPTWYDPFRDQLCELETVLDNLEAEVDAWRQDRQGWIASGISLWKRKQVKAIFGQNSRLSFSETTTNTASQRQMAWASKVAGSYSGARVEDGFLRSSGLGAKLVAPWSLVLDDLGIYYDATRPSRLEALIEKRTQLRPDQRQRAERLISFIVSNELSKYNTGTPAPDMPTGNRILVVGQVENDASVKKGCGTLRTNHALLQAAREANRNAIVIYKPHPDVEAGLRPGAIDAIEADVILTDCDPATILPRVDAVWTMTSLLGFEALLRGLTVTTFGTPFYAGWGLTRDRGEIPARRTARPDLAGLVHAVLIDYPRYLDPVTGRICPVEVLVERIASGQMPKRGIGNNTLCKLDRHFSYCLSECDDSCNHSEQQGKEHDRCAVVVRQEGGGNRDDTGKQQPPGIGGDAGFGGQ